MGTSTRSSDVRQRQECTDEASEPIVGVGDVVEQVKYYLVSQPVGREVGIDLPNVIIELMTTLEPHERGEPTRHVNVAKINILVAVLLLPLVYARPVYPVSDGPNVVVFGDLIQPIPTNKVLSPPESFGTWWTTCKCTGKNF